MAADINGYTAQYECRAGGSYCNVDVADHGSRACDTTITTSDSDGVIDTKLNNYRYVCVQAGDYTGKSTFRVVAGGAAGAYRVIRHTDASHNPVGQQNQAKLPKLVLGASYLIVQGLTFPSVDAPFGQRIYTSSGSNVIVNRILIEGSKSGFSNVYGAITIDCCNASDMTIQNSVIRNNWGKLGDESQGVFVIGGANIRLVNNEIYNWPAHPIQFGANTRPTLPGGVIENNDLYFTSDWYTSGGKMRGKDPLNVKATGTSGSPIKVIHNRIWGSRFTDLSACCIDSTPGAGIQLVTGNSSYVLFQSNIIFDNQVGLSFSFPGDSRNSIVGNIFYNHQRYSGSWGTVAVEFINNDSSEMYLNTIVSATQWMDDGASNSDKLCNVIIDGGTKGGNGNSFDYNAYYNTPGTYGEATKITSATAIISGALCSSLGCTAAANTTGRSVGDIVRTSANPVGDCRGPSDQACYLYKVTSVGSAGSVQAIRGPYVFGRKLQSAPEPMAIPYAQAHSSAPESYACPSTYASRKGLGVNDLQ
jgi:hypothetical protein